MASKNFTEMPTQCPECGGGVWDETKGRGKRSPKAPDCRCKDKDGCAWAGWYAKDSRPAQGAQRPKMAAGPALLNSVRYVKKFIAPEFQNPSNELIKEMAVVLTLAQTKDGCPLSNAETKAVEATEKPPLPQRPAAAPRRAEYDDADFTPGPYDRGSELPF